MISASGYKSRVQGLRIILRAGNEAGTLADSFYEQNGGRACSRPDDLFFLAMLDTRLVGCVRYCVEHRTPMLRTMMVDKNYRRQRVGSDLLRTLVEYLDDNHIRGTYCLPYAHLERFYGSAGFARVPASDLPAFLQERLLEYDPDGTHYLSMRRA